MSLNNQDILNMASRDYILGNTTIEEQIDFITEQIKDPFDSGSSNFFKKLEKMAAESKIDAICLDLFNQIEDVYSGIDFDFSETDSHLTEYFSAAYKFFIKNIQKHMYCFLREYILTSKNRKNLVSEYLNMKLPNYPKEQYGKKDFYILITKLPSIIKDIADDEITLMKFLSYIERAGDTPMYFSTLKDMLERGYMIDHGVVSDIFSQFMKSEQFDGTMAKLQMCITEDLINPYLEENGLSELKIPPVDPLEDEIDDDEDDTASEE